MRTIAFATLLLAVSSQLAPQTPPVSTPEEKLAQAHQALERDKPDDAIVILQSLAAAQPPMKGVQHELGIVYYRTGKLVEAQHAFSQAIEQDAADQESVQMLGLVLYRLWPPAGALPPPLRGCPWVGPS